ncbi:MAG: hypothetical protein JZU65_17100 [Chlorobium sp.]|nr:hypothetical protein [Chlorobium sp.]
MNNLLEQKSELERQLSELSDILDGLGNPAVAEKVVKMEVQKTELASRLCRLSSEIESTKNDISNISDKITQCSGGISHQLLEAIINQQIFFIKNKPKIIFDSHTGYLFPNPEYFENIPQLYGPDVEIAKFNSDISSIDGMIIEGYSTWILPDNKNILKYYKQSFHIIDNFATDKISLWPHNYSNLRNNRTRHFISSQSKRENRNYTSYLTDLYYENWLNSNDPRFTESKNDKAILFPFNDRFYSVDFALGNNVFTPQERAQKILNIFVQEGWIPKFDDEEITKLYERMYVIRPALIQTLVKMQEKLSELPPPKQGFVDGIDFAELIKGYDLASIHSSLVRYHAELVRWFSELLASLDDFSREQSPVLAEAQTLIDSLRDTIDEDDGQDAGEKILTERAQYLSKHLDFGLESLQAELVAFKNEAMTSRDTLTSARTLTDLRQIEKLERPDFYLVAEHSAELIKLRLQGVDWFREHKELATILIELHQEWRSDLHTFEHTTCTHFMEKCAGESIDSENGDAWFAEWRRGRLLAEEHLLPMMRAGIERVVPVEIVVETVKLLKSSIRDQLGNFFYDKRIALHQKFAFEPGGELQERFEKESALAAINSEFQKRLEELIFKIDGTEGRLFLVRWAKDWYDSLVGDVLAFIDKDEFHERIARETLDGFRAMKRHTLEAFLQDVKAYAVAREEKDKEWNSLLFRMRSDLAKKNGSAKK